MYRSSYLLAALFTTASIHAQFFPSSQASAQEQEQEQEQEEVIPAITVTGTATVKAEVDRIAWRLSMRGEGEQLAEAAATLEEITNELRPAIEGLENEAVRLRFSRIRSGRVYETVERQLSDGTREKERTLIGYYVERDATVHSDDLSASPVIEALLLRDNRVEIDGLGLSSSRHEELKQQALTDAVEAAKEKAERMIAVFPDQALGKVISLREGNSSDGRIRLTSNTISMPVFSGTGPDDAADFDEVEVTTTVTLEIGIE